MRLSERTSGISTNINLLRFVAAIFVIFSHSFYVASSQEDPFSIFSSGQTNFGGIAVSIFFFLSGFYVTKSLYKNNDIKQYFRKRCVRIFPQLWIVVLLAVLVLGPVMTVFPLKDYFSDIGTYIYLLNGLLLPVHNLPGVFGQNVYDATVNGPLWTMPVEFVAYCIIAVVLIVCKYIFKNEKIQRQFHIICTCVLLSAVVVLDFVVKNDFLVTVVRPLVVFFIGVLYCDYADKIKLNKPFAYVLFLLMGIACKLGGLNYALIFCLPYVVVTFALGTSQIRISSKLFLVSYEMYLLGWPIQQIITQLFGGEMNPYLNFITTLPLSVILALVLYGFIEKMEKRKTKIINK